MSPSGQLHDAAVLMDLIGTRFLDSIPTVTERNLNGLNPTHLILCEIHGNYIYSNFSSQFLISQDDSKYVSSSVHIRQGLWGKVSWIQIYPRIKFPSRLSGLRWCLELSFPKSHCKGQGNLKPKTL